MSTDTLMARAEAAFALEFASELALPALCEFAPKEVISMAFRLGWVKGRIDGLQDADRYADQAIKDAMIARAEGRA